MTKPLTIADLNDRFEVSTKAREYFETGKWLAIAKDKARDAILFARQGGASDRVVTLLAQKAAAGSSQPASGAWGSELVSAQQAYVESLKTSGGLFDLALNGGMKRVPMNTVISVVVSRMIGAAAVDEGNLKPAGEGLDLAQPQTALRKIGVCLISSAELVRLAGAPGLALLQAELRSATAAASDNLFISELLTIATPVAATNDPVIDLAALVSAIDTGSASRVFIAASPLNAKRLALARGADGTLIFPALTINGGTVAGMQIVPSDEISDTEILGFDASQIAGDGGTIVLNGATQATVDMGAGNLLALFQRNLLGYRSERMFSFEPVRSSGVAAKLTGVDLSGS